MILDLNLPGLGGLELLRRMLAAGAGPILVLSMHGEPLRWHALDAGAAGYVTKNASPDELLAAVRRCWRAGAMSRQAGPGPGHRRRALDQLGARELEILVCWLEIPAWPRSPAAVGVGYKTVANNCVQIKPTASRAPPTLCAWRSTSVS